MDRFHDRANKFINDVRKKKIKVCTNMYKDNKEQTKHHDAKHFLDVSNICPYCQKVFFNSRFLVRHVLRRHSDDLILLHNKCLKYECNNNSSDLKRLFSFLEEEFSVLKNELVMVKKAVAVKNVNIDYTEASKGEKNTDLHGNVSSASENKTAMHDDANELKILKENMCDREAVQCLHNKYEELCNVLKNEVVMKEDINELVSFNENILRSQELKYVELRQILLKDLQTMLSKHENNAEWKLHISELKHEIKKLYWVIDDIKKQVYSPDYVKILTEKFEEALSYSLNSTKHKCRKSRNSKSKSIISETRICCQPEENILVESDKHGTKTFSSMKHGQVPVIPYMSQKQLSSIIAEKLCHYNIAPNSSNISCAEFEEKQRLINTEKENLSMRYPNFSEIYKKIDLQAEHKVSKLQNKRSRKISFSEPLSTNMLHDSVSVDKNSLNKTYPLRQREVQHFTAAKNRISEHEGQEFTTFRKQKSIPDNEGFTFTDVGGSGDCLGIPENQNYATKETFKSTVTSMPRFKTSSPIEDIQISRRTKNTYNLNDSKCANSGPSSFSKTLDCAVVETKKNTVYTLNDQAELNEKYLLPNNLSFDEAEGCNKPLMDSIDNNSLPSLSSDSWDGENLH